MNNRAPRLGDLIIPKLIHKKNPPPLAIVIGFTHGGKVTRYINSDGIIDRIGSHRVEIVNEAR
jgi:hypothetical protein